jgi:opacity protein-like surface antigen
LTLAIASPVSAQVPVHVEVTPQIGYFFFNGDRSRDIEVNDDGLLYQIKIGVIFPGSWGLEGSAGLVASEFGTPDARRNTHSHFVGGAATYEFTNSSRFTPFVSAGAEMFDMDNTASGDQANIALVWGGGVKIKVSRHAAVRLEGRHHYYALSDLREAAEPDLWLSHFEGALGLAWRPWK